MELNLKILNLHNFVFEQIAFLSVKYDLESIWTEGFLSQDDNHCIERGHAYEENEGDHGFLHDWVFLCYRKIIKEDFEWLDLYFENRKRK